MGQGTTAQAELPTVCAWSSGTQSPEHKGENSAHQGPRDPAHCSPGHSTPSMQPRAPTPAEQMDGEAACEQNKLIRTSPKDRGVMSYSLQPAL